MSTLTSVCYSDILSSLFSNSTDLPNKVLVDLSRNKFSHADVASVSTHIEGSPRFPISRLIMDDCSLGVEGMHLIAQSLVERKPGTLKVFSAARNMSPGFFTSAGTIHAAQTAMCRLVKSSEPLVDLDLSGDDSHKFGAHIVPVVEALKVRTRVCERASMLPTPSSFLTSQTSPSSSSAVEQDPEDRQL